MAQVAVRFRLAPSNNNIIRTLYRLVMGSDFARCDDPHGKLHETRPPVDANNPELRKFVEMCFDPESPMNEKLKEAILKMLGEAKI